MIETLEVTGNCYEDAAMELTWVGNHQGWTLVHGRPVLQRPPFIRYGHAWLENEDGTVCWDPITRTEVPKQEYYELGQIKEEDCYQYKVKDVSYWIAMTKHWGPWEGPHGCGPLNATA